MAISIRRIQISDNFLSLKEKVIGAKVISHQNSPLLLRLSLFFPGLIHNIYAWEGLTSTLRGWAKESPAISELVHKNIETVLVFMIHQQGVAKWL